MNELVCRPIGVVRSPFRERAEAPRQTAAARDVRGTIELLPGHDFEHALEDLEMWPYLWVLFWFHLNEGWRPKVLPPRSAKRRGLFATRAPYRPNPIGMSAVKLEKVDGLVLHVSALDMLDGTPVLDLKPYVPYADALADAEGGWLETGLDPQPGFEVELAERAARELGYLRDTWHIELEDAIRRVLVLGPQQHPYRRIRRVGDAMMLAVKDFRARFTVDGRRIVVHAITSGYRPRELATNPAPELEPHRALVGMRAKSDEP
ncbi:MAG TPA: tRNA (N6-threonylcarbamoyladenosine(37)-N6)-methyltransferase TrmO [Polyangiaceae bacterium]|nr:tRNA (N6-threonylcarbamoyladenosine(37)-N6)-methyltransferase TrmO [Polyangiaceae bacterium]